MRLPFAFWPTETFLFRHFIFLFLVCFNSFSFRSKTSSVRSDFILFSGRRDCFHFSVLVCAAIGQKSFILRYGCVHFLSAFFPQKWFIECVALGSGVIPWKFNTWHRVDTTMEAHALHTKPSFISVRQRRRNASSHRIWVVCVTKSPREIVDVWACVYRRCWWNRTHTSRPRISCTLQLKYDDYINERAWSER